MNELVSIITPTYNSAKYIAETITSVQQQTYQNWEMLIADDCSTDQTVEIIQQFMEEDHRIHLIRMHKNTGAGIARNTALNRANGRYIAFLDADDLWLPTKLEKQLEFLKVKNIPFTFCFYECIDENSNVLNLRIEAPNPLTYRQLFFCNFIGNLTGVYDTNYFGKIPISSMKKRQDWIVWLSILKQIKIAYPVTESLALYRVREDSISASKTELLKHNFGVYRKFHKKNIAVAVFCMIGFLFTQLIIKPRYIKFL